VDLVLSGGGVRGIALVGAVEAMAARGLRFVNHAGTSAGALIAALLAAGYTPAELRALSYQQDFTQCLDQFPRGLPRYAVAGWNLIWHWGLFRGKRLRTWVNQLLQAKGVCTFGDIKRTISDSQSPYPLRLVASDVSTGRLLVLPDDLPRYGHDPDRFPIADAVRMSTSIPYLFRPVPLLAYGRKHLIVDGALLSNYPMSALDRGHALPRPVLGVRLIKTGNDQQNWTGPANMLRYFLALALTAMRGLDNRYLETHNYASTIEVDTGMVPTTQFELSADEKWALYAAGFAAAEAFLEDWSPEGWRTLYQDWYGQSRDQFFRKLRRP
jgi:NTE family protein